MAQVNAPHMHGSSTTMISAHAYPISRGMSGWSVGKIRLKERSPPTAIVTHAWTSNTLYSRLPLTAGFFEAVDDRGANAAVAFVNLFSSFPRSGPDPLVLGASSGASDVVLLSAHRKQHSCSRIGGFVNAQARRCISRCPRSHQCWLPK